MMRTSTSSIFSLLALALLVVVDASVQDACKAAAARSPSVKFDFCVAALSSDPASGSADDKGLAIIATKLTAAKATGTEAKIEGLLKGRPGGRTEECLKTCLDLYTDLIPTLGESLDSLRSGRLEDAKTELSAALDKPVDCEDSFAEGEVPSPLTQENASTKQHSAIALAITNML